jgi:hypothetical protein
MAQRCAYGRERAAIRKKDQNAEPSNRAIIIRNASFFISFSFHYSYTVLVVLIFKGTILVLVICVHNGCQNTLTFYFFLVIS